MPSNLYEPEDWCAANVSQIERRSLRHSRYATTPLQSDRLGIFPRRRRSSFRKRKIMSIRSTLVVITAIATLGLGSPAFAASYGGLSNDSGSMMPSYYDKSGWHPGLPPAARAALAAPQHQPGRGLHLYAGPRFSSIAHPVPGANGPAAPVQAPCLTKCCKMTGSGRDCVSYNARNGDCAQCRRQ